MAALPFLDSLDPPSSYDDPREKLNVFAAEREKAVQEHQQFAQQKQVELQQVQEKQGDLVFADRLLKLTDSTVPKQAREFIFREMSRALGVDPKSERSKELGKMLTSFDPDTLYNLRTNIGTQIEKGNPGAVKQMAKGLLSGQISVTDFVGQVQGADRSRAAKLKKEKEGLVQQAAFTPGEDQALAVDQPEADGPPVQLAQAQTNETATDVYPLKAPRFQEAPPSLTGQLGLDSNKRYRVDDLVKQGFKNIPTDEKEQQKLVEKLENQHRSTATIMNQITILHDIVKGRPEVLGIKVRIPGTSVEFEINPSDIDATIKEQVEGIRNVYGVKPDAKLADQLDRFSDTGSFLGTLAGDVADVIVKNVYPAGETRFEETAKLRALMKSHVVSLAYSLAAAKGQAGRDLSDKDLEFQLREIGAGGNSKAFAAVLTGLAEKTYRGYKQNTKSAAGQTVDLVSRLTADEDLQKMADSESLPKELRNRLRVEAKGRGQMVHEEGQSGLSRTVQERLASQRSQIPATDQTAPEGQQQEGRPPAPGGDKSGIPTPQATPPVNKQGQVPSLEEEEAAVAGRAQEDREMKRRAEGRDVERLDIEKDRNVRAAGAEERAERGEQRAERSENRAERAEDRQLATAERQAKNDEDRLNISLEELNLAKSKSVKADEQLKKSNSFEERRVALAEKEEARKALESAERRSSDLLKEAREAEKFQFEKKKFAFDEKQADINYKKAQLEVDLLTKREARLEKAEKRAADNEEKRILIAEKAEVRAERESAEKRLRDAENDRREAAKFTADEEHRKQERELAQKRYDLSVKQEDRAEKQYKDAKTAEDRRLALAARTEARAEKAEARQALKDQYDEAYRRRQEARQARLDEEKRIEERRERFRAAFQALAKAIAGGSRGADIPSAGGARFEQDPRAFQITQAPQRVAPRVGR